jgi:hypothetical protein
MIKLFGASKIRLCSQKSGNQFQKNAKIITGKFLEIDWWIGTQRSDLGYKKRFLGISNWKPKLKNKEFDRRKR